jgi:hypothetical protein
MTCTSCNNELRVIKGGMQTSLESQDIKMVQVWGCMNKDCELSMQEQKRTEVIVEQFVD